MLAAFERNVNFPAPAIFSFQRFPLKSVCIASIYGILTSGTFENHYIVSPYNILLMTIFMIAYTALPEQIEKER